MSIPLPVEQIRAILCLSRAGLAGLRAGNWLQDEGELNPELKPAVDSEVPGLRFGNIYPNGACTCFF